MMKKTTETWLERKAENYIRKFWPQIKSRPKIYVDRLKLDKNSLSEYYPTLHIISFSSKENKKMSKKKIKKLLLHELCHWYLDVTGQPCGDGKRRFALELIRVGIGKFYNDDKKGKRAHKKAIKYLKRHAQYHK